MDDSEGNVHVVPTYDLIDHIENEDCPCGPTAQPVEDENGSVSWVMIHHSLDGRESTE